MKRIEKAQTSHPRGRRITGRARQDHVDDPYLLEWKPRGPAVCRDCGAAFRDGRWQWISSVPATAEPELCPACRRVRDSFPAGIVTLSGSFVTEHKSDILNVTRHQEELENKEHPLNRIMGIREDGDSIEITTTDIHLPRRIGEALHRAYHGDLDYHYEAEKYFLRVRWSCDDAGTRSS